jgi:hypothetical protein
MGNGRSGQLGREEMPQLLLQKRLVVVRFAHSDLCLRNLRKRWRLRRMIAHHNFGSAH